MLTMANTVFSILQNVKDPETFGNVAGEAIMVEAMVENLGAAKVTIDTKGLPDLAEHVMKLNPPYQ